MNLLIESLKMGFSISELSSVLFGNMGSSQNPHIPSKGRAGLGNTTMTDAMGSGGSGVPGTPSRRSGESSFGSEGTLLGQLANEAGESLSSKGKACKPTNTWDLW